MYSIEIFDVRPFYVNLHFSKDSRELETLVLGTRIMLTNYLFDEVFDMYSIVPYMNSIWLDNFEFSFVRTKEDIVESSIGLLDIGPLSLCFKNIILVHMIATIHVP